MPQAAAILAAIGIALLLLTLTGLIVRHRWSTWYSFTVYIAVMAAFSTAFIVWPETFYTPTNWLVQTSVMNGLRFAMALELAARTFQAFPGARATLRPILLALLGITLALVLAIPSAEADYSTVVAEIQPRLINGMVWLFTAIAALILWYRLPVAYLHKNVLLSYVPYLFFELVYSRLFVKRSWENELLSFLYPLPYLLLTAHWAWIAWRRVEEPAQTEPPARPRKKSEQLLSRLSEI